MSQAHHGGNLAQAAREFGVPEHALLDFSANLNVFAPEIPEETWARWRSDILRYPEADADQIRQKLAVVYGVSASALLPTAGAIEGLYLVARLFPGARVGVVEPAFSDYARAFEAAGESPERIALPPERWHPPAQEWAHLLEPFEVVVLGNPNNPTGALQSRSQMEALLNRAWAVPKAWIVDEAFMEFVAGEESMLSVLEKHPSLVVVRSLTKSWGIPGLRLGFVATHNRKWMEQLAAMQPPWSVNGVAAQWAQEFLEPERHRLLLDGLAALRDIGERFASALAQLPGIKVHDSACNFLLVELANPVLDTELVYREMGRRGILVRRCDSFFGMPKGRFIRLAVRGEAENNRVLGALSEVCRRFVSGSEEKGA